MDFRKPSEDEFIKAELKSVLIENCSYDPEQKELENVVTFKTEFDKFIAENFIECHANYIAGDIERCFEKVPESELSEKFKKLISNQTMARGMSYDCFKRLCYFSLPAYLPLHKFVDEAGGHFETISTHYIPLLVSSLKLTNDTVLEKHREGGTEANINMLFINWLLSLVKASYVGIPNKMGIVLAGPKGIGKDSFFRGLLPHNLKDAYNKVCIEEQRSECYLDNQMLCCFSRLKINNSRVTGLVNQLLNSSSVGRRYVKNSYMISNRYGSFCGTIDTDEILPQFVEGNLYLINISGIDFDIYNSIDKKKLLMEVVGMYHAANRFFKG